jgi:hypothetical protein
MRPRSLKDAVDRSIEGYSFMDAISEFLDEFYLSGQSERQHMLADEPALTGVAFQDAYVGAVGEHLARRWGLCIPLWADDSRRFLDTPRFPEFMELAKPVFLRDSPVAFRRRLIFTEAEPLRRARFPRDD